MPEEFDLVATFFVLASQMRNIAIALMIALPIHPGAHARMQYLAVQQLRVFQIIQITMNTFFLFRPSHTLIDI